VPPAYSLSPATGSAVLDAPDDVLEHSVISNLTRFKVISAPTRQQDGVQEDALKTENFVVKADGPPDRRVRRPGVRIVFCLIVVLEIIPSFSLDAMARSHDVRLAFIEFRVT